MSLSYACVHEIYIWVSPSILAILLHVYCKHVKALIPGVHCSAIFYYWTVGVSVENRNNMQSKPLCELYYSLVICIVTTQ